MGARGCGLGYFPGTVLGLRPRLCAVAAFGGYDAARNNNSTFYVSGEQDNRTGIIPKFEELIMNKREVTWLIVRLIGAYFGYLAIVALFTLASTVWLIFSVPSSDKGAELSTQVAPTSFSEQPGGIPGIQEPTPRARPEAQRNANKPDPAADEAKRAIFKRVLWDLFVFLLVGGVAYYLLFRGGLFFSILMRENKPGEVKEREPESILLNLSE
jgi:hypothetical protein